MTNLTDPNVIVREDITEEIAGKINIESGIDKTGEALNKFDWSSLLSWVGNKVSKVTGYIVEKLSGAGINPLELSIKLLTLALFSWVLYFFLHLGKKPVKIIGAVLTILFIISVVVSIFFAV